MDFSSNAAFLVCISWLPASSCDLIICLSVCLSLRLSLHPAVCLFLLCLSVCLSVFLSVCVFFHPSSETEPFICLCLPLNGSTRLTLGPSLRPSLCVSINLSVLPSDHSSVRPSLCVCPSVRLSIRLSVRLFVYLSIIGNGTFSTPFPAVLSSLRRNYCGKQMNSVSFTF